MGMAGERMRRGWRVAGGERIGVVGSKLGLPFPFCISLRHSESAGVRPGVA